MPMGAGPEAVAVPINYSCNLYRVWTMVRATPTVSSVRVTVCKLCCVRLCLGVPVCVLSDNVVECKIMLQL